MKRDWKRIAEKLHAYVAKLMPSAKGRRARLSVSSIAQEAIVYGQASDKNKLSTVQLEAVLRKRAKGELLDRIRRERRKRPLPSDSGMENFIPQRGSIVSSLAKREQDAIRYSDAEDKLTDLLAPLTPDQRRIIRLRLIAEESWNEIAQKLEITPANARVRFTRAKRALLLAHLEPLRTHLAGEEWLVLELRGVAQKPWHQLSPLVNGDIRAVRTNYIDILRPHVIQLLPPFLGDLLARD